MGGGSDGLRLWKVGAIYDCLPFCWHGSLQKREGDMVGKNEPVSRSIEGWEEDFVVCIYVPVFTVG